MHFASYFSKKNTQKTKIIMLVTVTTCIFLILGKLYIVAGQKVLNTLFIVLNLNSDCQLFLFNNKLSEYQAV